MLLAALTVILLTSLVILWLFLGAQRDPTGSAHGMIGSALWPTLGPHLALLVWFGVVLSLFALRSRWKRFAFPVLMFSAAAAGGNVNVVSALRLRSMTGGDPYAFPERVKAVSSYAFLGPGLPATLVLAPEKDGLVPSWSFFRFDDHARLAGGDIELVRIPFANHVYNQLAANSLGNQTRRSVTLRFLNERLPGR